MIDIKNMSILIVDDVKTMRAIIRKMLKNLKIGKTLYTAENGLEGLKVMHSARVDLAIVDWKMPVMDGSQLLETIRNDKKLRDIPVLLVTAESQKDIVLEAAEIEVEGYLLKPLTPSVLENKIISIINQINNPDEATIHLHQARDFEEKDNLNSAIEHMKHVVQLRPTASRHLRNLGLLYQKVGDEETAERCLKKAASVNSQDAVTIQILGDVYWKQNNLIPAARCYLEVISLTGKFSDKALSLGQILMEKQHTKFAKSIFSKLISKAYKNSPIKETIVDICIENHEFEYSKAVLVGLIKDFPSNYGLIFKTGVVCEMMNSFDEALEYFLAIEKKQTSRIDVKLKIAKIYYEKNKTIQADNYLNMVLQRDPDNEEALALRRLL
jgi:CheY-like chemotaxis protein